jgi:hypothetical protein
MTIITALSGDDGIYYGYNDGCEIGGTPVFSSHCPWILFGNWALGITGQSILQSVLQTNIDQLADIEDDFLAISNEISKIFASNDIGTRSDEGYINIYGIYSILLHKSGKIWDLSGCLSATMIPMKRLWARGSGREYAVGADYSLLKLNANVTTEERVCVATEAAIVNDIYCVGNPVVKSF